MATIDNLLVLKQDVLARRTINVSTGSVVETTMLSPVANMMNREDLITEFVTRLQSLDSLVAMESDTAFLTSLSDALRTTTDQILLGVALYLDTQAAQYGLTRQSANFAIGNIFLGRATAPTVDITVPSGTVVFSSQTSQRYVTTATATMTVANSGNFFDVDSQLYVLNIPIQALSLGTGGNIGQQLIDSVESAISGITIIFNKEAITTGVDQESDSSLADRIKRALAGTNLGTTEGYRRLILQNNPLISDLYVSGAQDPFMIRDLGDGGAIDIYLLDKNLTTVSEIVTTSTPVTDFVLTSQPAKSITSIAGKTQGVDYTLVEDTVSFAAGSTEALSHVHWITAAPLTYTVTYQVDSNVINVQTFINAPENHFLGADVLIKEGLQINVDLFASIRVSSGFTSSVVVGGVLSAITNFLNSLRLGQSVQQSDVLKVMLEVDGVDEVVLPLSKFNVSTSTGVVDTIIITGREFARPNQISVGVVA